MDSRSVSIPPTIRPYRAAASKTPPGWRLAAASLTAAAGMGGNLRWEQAFQAVALRGSAGAGGDPREPHAGSARDALLPTWRTGGSLRSAGQRVGSAGVSPRLTGRRARARERPRGSRGSGRCRGAGRRRCWRAPRRARLGRCGGGPSSSCSVRRRPRAGRRSSPCCSGRAGGSTSTSLRPTWNRASWAAEDDVAACLFLTSIARAALRLARASADRRLAVLRERRRAPRRFAMWIDP